MNSSPCSPSCSRPIGRSGSTLYCHGPAAGVTLLEVMIAVMILGILMTGLTQISQTVIQTMGFGDDYSQTSGTVDFAMARMVRFVGDTYEISSPPDDGANHDELEVVERTLDLVDINRAAGSDGLVDADTDADGLVNEWGGDGKEYVTFALDKTDSDNWKLEETVPNYLTADPLDFLDPQVICEHVIEFVTKRLDTSVVLIRLTTGKNEMSATLETRARARLIFP